MLSILIPCYNYNAFPLAQKLEKQAKKTGIPFELFCVDDGSHSEHNRINEKVNTLSNCHFIAAPYNRGRIGLRQYLTSLANYEHLLFVDADTMPRESDYIQKYLKVNSSSNDAIFGGIIYENQPPPTEYMLRWNYGHRYETKKASVRNQDKYQNIVSANFLIKKSVFKKINSHLPKEGYGLDNYFGALLKKERTTVLHINNPVYHLGLDKSTAYLQKVEQSIDTLLILKNTPKTIATDNALLSIFSRTKKFKLNTVIAKTFKLSKPALTKNLISPKPSVRLLQFYKLGYICYKDLN